MNQPTAAGRGPVPPAHRACPRSLAGPASRPNWTGCGCRRRRTPGKATPLTLLEAFEGRRQLIAYYFMWNPGRPAPEQCEGCTFYTSQVAELSYLHSRDITYAVFCQGRNVAVGGAESQVSY